MILTVQMLNRRKIDGVVRGLAHERFVISMILCRSDSLTQQYNIQTIV